MLGHYRATTRRWTSKTISYSAIQAATIAIKSPHLGHTSNNSFIAALSLGKSQAGKNKNWSPGAKGHLKVPMNPLCSPWDSCAGRCEQNFSRLPFSCNCDSMCTAYGDCCVDFLIHCDVNQTIDGFRRMRLEAKSSYPICMAQNDSSWPFFIVNFCPPSWSNDSVRMKCENMVNSVSLSLVRGPNGLLYTQNCAICNGLSNNETLGINSENQRNWKVSSHSNSFSSFKHDLLHDKYLEKEGTQTRRHCFPSVNTCKFTNMHLQGYSLDWLCWAHSGIVVSISSSSEQLKAAGTAYKNVYCALCNEEDLDSLTCPAWIFHDRSASTDLLNDFPNLSSTTLDWSRNKVQHDIPAAFSILLNFGLDGKERMMFSSEGEEEMRRNMARCKSGQMWDPFSNICRKVYCSTEFVFVDFRCVRKSNITNEKEPGSEGDPILADVDSIFVGLVLTIEMDYFDVLEIIKNEKLNMRNMIKISLAKMYKISADRIQDVQIKMQPYSLMLNDSETENIMFESLFANPVVFKVEFKLYEPCDNLTKSEPTVDSIVSSMSSSVAQNTFYLDIYNRTSKVFEIHESLETLTDWCGPRSNGRQLDYWNQEFTLILNENSTAVDTWVKSVYINGTGRIYEKGEFIANILFQGYRDFGNLINVSGVVVVCERELLNASCPRMELKEKEFEILPNKTLIYHGDPILESCLDLSQYEITHNSSILVCYDVDKLKSLLRKDVYRLNFDQTEAYVSFVLTCISILALAVVLFTYIVFTKHRNLPGCNLMNLTLSLFTMQLSFLIGQRTEVTGASCIVAGILLHYEILASFFWMNVMAFDLYQTFGHEKVLPLIRSKRKYLPRYMAYSYGLPLVIVSIAFAADSWNYDIIAPRYGEENTCWIANRYAALLFFASPLALVMISNLCFYILTISSVLVVQRKIKFSRQHAQGKSDVILYARMATVMGFTWIFGFAAALIPNEGFPRKILVYLFLGFNCLQGLFIFFAFVCNRRVARLLQNMFLTTKHSRLVKCHYCHRIICTCEANIMMRSASADTCFSTVSLSTISEDCGKKEPKIMNATWHRQIIRNSDSSTPLRQNPT
ncbi:uncharacterized protein LOC111086352 [Limulus polyphemus]|uniref:Uncharacterized protein LOC111086352 n=1 Tax=Limulus polyphemus TaxID=6850 RepID=A0ABM1SLN8_LIMPO|nr:uncharacterized protein LOC111086352 [Limulus polyphemus]